MGQIHFEDRISLYLNDESHGHHNLAHIHIQWSDGKNASYDMDGNLIVGSNRDQKLISAYIKNHNREVFENYKLLKQGRSLKKIMTKIYK